MKKLFFVFVLAIVCSFSYGQRAGFEYLGANSNQDTITNADTVLYSFSETIRVASVVSAGVKVDSISGTPAGYIDYQGSVDNVNWITLERDTITDVAQAYHTYNSTGFAYPYLRISVSTAGATAVLHVSPQAAYKQN